ncbi:hypothetical protein CDIK_2919 [Cucumispora dikerogammari]|nr:hypothetical protein CDIK_2919 [Cucumispora dikerogammari]
MSVLFKCVCELQSFFLGFREADWRYVYKCCRFGVVGLPIELPYPELLKDMLINPENRFFNNFNKLIHRYNAVFRIAALVDRVDSTVAGGRSWVCRVSGNIYHILSLIRDNSDSPNLGQLYLLDPVSALV